LDKQQIDFKRVYSGQRVQIDGQSMGLEEAKVDAENVQINSVEKQP